MHRKPGRVSVTQQKLDRAGWLTLGPRPAPGPTRAVRRVTEEKCALQLILEATPVCHLAGSVVFFFVFFSWATLANIMDHLKRTVNIFLFNCLFRPNWTSVLLRNKSRLSGQIILGNKCPEVLHC